MSIFYKKNTQSGKNILSEEESKHCALVLRHQQGDEITVFDGVGGKHQAMLTKIAKRACEFEIIETITLPQKPFNIHLGIAPTKNMDRMEWMVEKLCEMGVDEVSFIKTQHSERKQLRLDRLEKKAISAMKQSGNPFLLQLNDLVDFDSFISSEQRDIKLIAHVDPSHSYISKKLQKDRPVSILIGPEGDFSSEEVENATKAGFEMVSLGTNTLRTETAGLVACCSINIVNQY